MSCESLKHKIILQHGMEVFRLTRIFSSLLIKKSKLLCTLIFMLRCRDKHVIPNCVRINHIFQSKRNSRTFDRANRMILIDHIHNVRRDLHFMSRDINELHYRLESFLNPDLMAILFRISHLQAEKVRLAVTARHIKKFEQLYEKQHPTQEMPAVNSRPEVVVNLTSVELSQSALSVLGKGFNFSVAPRSIPIEKVIIGVETAVRRLPKPLAEEIRQDASRILKECKVPRPNLTLEERIALNDLRENKDIIILKADKGNATVLMNTDEYMEKMRTILNDPCYKKLERNPTTTFISKLTSLLKEAPFSKELIEKLKPQDCVIPKMYGLPKYHKPGIPLRPIVSAIKSPPHEIARFVAQLLKHENETVSSYVKNSVDFVDKVKGLKLNQEDILVSLDVVSLFNNVPVKEAMTVLREKKKIGKQLCDLIEGCLNCNYFSFDGELYKQQEGLAMGSPLSPLVANLFMEDLEETALRTTTLQPMCYYRYVDDCFLVWKHGEEKLGEFVDHINGINPKIQFTVEREDEKKNLPFLDVMLGRRQDGTLSHTVYRKKTNTNRYLNAKSHHHPCHKKSVLHSLITRSRRLTDADHLPDELNYLRKIFENNGYSSKEISRAMNFIPTSQIERKRSISTAIIPYASGITDKIGRMLKKHNIETIYTPDNKLQGQFRTIKDKIPMENCGVYQIPCECGLVYIGQTKKALSERLKQHKYHEKCKNSKLSAVAKHSIEEKHTILYEESKIIDQQDKRWPRCVSESIQIIKHPHNFNGEDCGYAMSASWATAVGSLYRHEKVKLNTATRDHTSDEFTQTGETGYNLRPRKNKDSD